MEKGDDKGFRSLQTGSLRRSRTGTTAPVRLGPSPVSRVNLFCLSERGFQSLTLSP